MHAYMCMCIYIYINIHMYILMYMQMLDIPFELGFTTYAEDLAEALLG